MITINDDKNYNHNSIFKSNENFKLGNLVFDKKKRRGDSKIKRLEF